MDMLVKTVSRALCVNVATERSTLAGYAKVGWSPRKKPPGVTFLKLLKSSRVPSMMWTADFSCCDGDSPWLCLSVYPKYVVLFAPSHSRNSVKKSLTTY